MVESVIRIKADATQAVSQLAALRSAVNSAYTALDKQAETIKEVRANQRSLNTINKTTTGLVKKLTAEFSKLTKRSKEQKQQFNQEIAGLKALNAQFSSLSMRLRQGTRDMRGFALAVRNSGKNLQFMGRSIMIGMLPFLNGIRNASRFAKSLEEAEIRLMKIADLTTSELAPVADELLKISEAFGVSRDLITGIAADFALVGFPVDQLHNLASAANELAILGQIDVGPAKDIFVSTVFAMRNMATLKGEVLSFADATKQATGQMYLFNIVNNNTALAISDLAEAIPKLVPITTQFGLTITEAAGALAAMKASGVSANEGTTALRTGLLRLTSLTKQADEKVQAARDTLADFNFTAGVGVETIAAFGDSITAIRTQVSDAAAFDIVKNILGIRQTAKVQLFVLDMEAASHQIKTTLDIMKDLSGSDPFAHLDIKTIKDFSTASKEATQPMKDAALAMLKDNKALSSVTSQFLRGLIIQMAGVEHAADMSMEEIQKVLDSDAWKMQQAKVHMKNALTDLGGQINMLLVDYILPIVNKMVNAFNRLSDSTKKWIVIIAGVVGAFGPILYMMAIIKMAFGQTLNIIMGAVGKIIASITSSTTAGILAANQEQAAIILVTEAKLNETMVTHQLAAAELKLHAVRTGGTKAAAQRAGVGIAAESFRAGAAQNAKAVTDAAKAGTAATLLPLGGKGVGSVPGGARMGIRARIASRFAGFGREFKDPGRPDSWFREGGEGPTSGRRVTATRQRRVGRQAGLVRQNFLRGFRDPTGGLTQDPSAWQRLIGPARQARWSDRPDAAGRYRDPATGRFRRRVPDRPSGAGRYRDPATGRFRGPLTPRESVRRWRDASGRFVSPGGRPAGGIGPPLPHGLRGAGTSQRIGYNLRQYRDARFGGAFAAGAKPPGGIGPRLPFGRGVMATGDPRAGRVLAKQAFIGGKAMARTGMGKVAKQASKFKDTLMNIPKIIKNIKNPLQLILKVFRSTTFIGIAFGVALGIAAAVFATIKGDWENFKNAMEPGIAALKEAWGALMDGVKAIIEPFVDLFNKFSFGAKKGETQGTSLGKKFVAALQPVIILLKWVAFLFKTVGFAVGIAVDIAQPALNLLFNLITPIIEIVKAVISLFKLDFEAALQHLNRAVGSIMISIIRLFGTMFEWVIKGMMSFTHVTEGLIRLLARIPGMGFLDHVADGIQGWRDQVNGFAGDLVDGVINQIGGMAGIDESEMFGFRDEELRDIAGEAGSVFAGEANDAIREGLGTAEPGIYDATNTEAGEAGITAGKTFIDHFWSAFKKFAKEFKKETKNAMKGIHEELLAIFDTQTQAMDDMYQSQIDGINAVIKEEQRLSREVAYQTKRRDMIRDRALANDAYRRNRALAIYEGRIDDARSLDLKEKRQREQGGEKLTGFDSKRAQTLLNEQRKANMDQLAEERRHQMAILEERRNAYADGLAELLNSIPKNQAEWDEYFNGENGVLALTATAFTGMMDSMPVAGDFDYTGITSDVEGMKNGIVSAWDEVATKMDAVKLYFDPDNPDNPASMAFKMAELANATLNETYEWTPETGFLSWLTPYMDEEFAKFEERIADFKASHAEFLEYLKPPPATETPGGIPIATTGRGDPLERAGDGEPVSPAPPAPPFHRTPMDMVRNFREGFELLVPVLFDQLTASGALDASVRDIEGFVDPEGRGRGYFEVLRETWADKQRELMGWLGEDMEGWRLGVGTTRSDFVEGLFDKLKGHEGDSPGTLSLEDIENEIIRAFGRFDPAWMPEVAEEVHVLIRAWNATVGRLMDPWAENQGTTMMGPRHAYGSAGVEVPRSDDPFWSAGSNEMGGTSGEIGGSGSWVERAVAEDIDPHGLLPNMRGVHQNLIGGVLMMAKDAKRAGLNLTAKGNRSMFDQKRIFNDRYKPITAEQGYDATFPDGKGVDYVAASRAGGLGDKVWNGVTYRYKKGGDTGEGEVAVPGTSYHAIGVGEAVDISGPDGQKSRRHTFMDNWSGKHGVHTPLAHEPWHWERTNGPRSLRGYFTGGMVGGAGSAGQMIMAHGQEFMMSAAATRRIGVGALNNMNNYAKFTGPNSAGGGTTNTSSSTVNIYVDTFIGERGWFEKMMSDYNINVAPSSERVRGIERRTVGSYTDSNTRSRV